MIEVIGYISALVIGLSLGLLGSGGSILTVPLLLFFFDLDPITATAYSLFIVGSTALAGGLLKMKRAEVHFKTVFWFAPTSALTVYLFRAFLIPNLPEILIDLGPYSLSKGGATILLFSAIMLLAGWRMLKKRNTEPEDLTRIKPLSVITRAVLVGAVAGCVGAGGGFLIVPALVLFLGLSIEVAIGTSLWIIAIQSYIGFIGDIQNRIIDWPLLLGISALAILGIFLGLRLAQRLEAEKLKSGFGYFVMAMALVLFITEFIIA